MAAACTCSFMMCFEPPKAVKWREPCWNASGGLPDEGRIRATLLQFKHVHSIKLSLCNLLLVNRKNPAGSFLLSF